MSKIVFEASSLSAKDGSTEKSNSKATKTSKKSHQSKKSPGKAAASKDVRTGDNVSFSGNMAAVSQSMPPCSNVATKTLYTGVTLSPSLGMNSGSYVGQNPQAAKSSQQMLPIQPMTMTIQRIPKIDSIFSYQPNALGGASHSGGFTKICIDSVKDLSLGPSGKVVPSVVTSPDQPPPAPIASKQMSRSDANNFVMLNSKAIQRGHTGLPQSAPPPYQVIQKATLPSGNITSQGDLRRHSFQSLTTPCTSAPVTTGDNLTTTIGMVQQSPMNFPPMNISQAMSLPTGHITTSGTYTKVPQTSQVKPSDPEILKELLKITVCWKVNLIFG